MRIIHIREYKPTHTDGEIFINGKEQRFCHTLEDVARPTNVKFYGETCIPEGCYDVIVSHSQRFNKPMLLLFNREDFSLVRDGKSFTGIRCHGGNDIEDSDACVIAAYQSNKNGRVWDRASDDLCELVAQAITKGERVQWITTSA